MSGLWSAFAQLLAPIAAYIWSCDRDDCDGSPHEGWNYLHARTKQRLPVGAWFIWLLVLGRGWGKTRTGAECFLDLMLANPVDVEGTPTEWLIASRTWNDTVKLCLEGPSGLFNALKRRRINYRWVASDKMVYLEGGQRIHITYAEDDRLGQGRNLAGFWLDELGSFKRIVLAWTEGLVPSLRAKLPTGQPCGLVTTTPNVRYAGALSLIKGLMKRAETSPSVRVTVGSTFENSHNLAEATLAEWLEQYPKGSKAYRQEFLGEIADEIEGAMWTWESIHSFRVTAAPELTRKLVTVDPSYSNGPDSDETGLLVLGSAALGDGKERRIHVYALEDHSARMSVDTWPKLAVRLAVAHSSEILIEVDNAANANAKMLRDAARDLGVSCPRIHEVRAASTGSKSVRATPVVAHYLNGRVHHVGELPELETQMTTWVPEQSKDSPDHVDALVHGVTWLMKPKAAPVKVRNLG